MNKDIKRVEEDKDSEIKRLNNIADKLEQRISSLEKVLDSHAKCIGEMREENFIPIRKDQIEDIEKELER
jgi:exonuclease VII small subunit